MTIKFDNVELFDSRTIYKAQVMIIQFKKNNIVVFLRVLALFYIYNSGCCFHATSSFCVTLQIPLNNEGEKTFEVCKL